ncbi:MAG: fibronectin type III domain-containing protein, partial [bacterium]
SIAVTWTAPAGERSISRYTATAQPGGATCTWTGGPLACTLTGLENGTAYTVRVRAVNPTGTGTESAGREAVPFGVPGTPRPPVLALAGSDRAVQASWAAPDSGGRSLTRLEVDVEPGAYGCTVVSGARFATGSCATGTPYAAYGVEYRVRMRAANEAGWGAWSEWSAGFTPRIAPSAPVQISARAGDQRALIAWTASEPRGAPVERYAVCLTGSHVDDPGPPPRADPGSRSCGPGTFAKPLVCDVPAEPDEVPGKTVHACTGTGLRTGPSVGAGVDALLAVGWSGSDVGRRWFSPSTRVEPSTTASGFARVRIRCSPTSGIPVCIVRVRLEVDFKPYVFRSPQIRLEPRTWTTVDVGMPEDVRERLGSEGFARARVVVESSALEVVEAPQVLELAAPPAEGVGEVKMEPVSSTDKVAVGVPCNGTRYDRCTGYMELKEFAQVRARAGGGVLARVRFSVRGGEVARVELRLNARARALLRRRGELTVRPVLTTVGGTTAPRLAPVRLVAADPTGVAARIEAVAAALDRAELLTVVRAAAAQELAWPEAITRLERDVLPGYRRAVDQARAVPKGAPRMREARELLIAAALRQVAAVEAYATWLRDDDLAANQRAVVDDRTARAWLAEALGLARAERAAAEAP